MFAEYLIAEKYAYISQHKEIKNADDLIHRATSWIPLRKTSKGQLLIGVATVL